MRLILAWLDDWAGDDISSPVDTPVIRFSTPTLGFTVVDGGAGADIVQLTTICDVVETQHTSDVVAQSESGRRFSTLCLMITDVIENLSEMLEGSLGDVSARDEMTSVVDGSHIAEVRMS